MMSDITLGITAVAFSRDHELVQYAKKHYPGKVILNENGRRLTPEELRELLGKCNHAIVGLDPVDGELIKDCPKLKIISKYGVGLDNIDFAACEENAVLVTYPKGVNKRSVSEEFLGCALSLLRNLYITSNRLKYNNEWFVDGGIQLTGKTVGVIGVGYTGKDVIELLRPFDCRILVNDIVDQQSYYDSVGAQSVSKEYIYEHADVITLHTPRTKETVGMIDASALSKMKKTAIVINIARGGLVDEEALKVSLLEGRIGGAALDVYLKEPPSDRALLEIPNLMCMPHIGGNAREAVLAMGHAAIDNLLREINED